jgi:hypothetical protein
MKVLTFAASFLFLGLLSAMAQELRFDHLEVKPNSVRTTHHAKYLIKIDSSFKLLGEFHHQPVYDKKQFDVSVAAYSDGKDLIMFHAETHTDGSGGLDYSKLTPATLNNLSFNSREQCAALNDEAELSENPQIKFIRSKGFDLSLPFYLKQYFATSEDGKAEVVISYGTKIASCENITASFRTQIEDKLKSKISVKGSK